jgi:hypothetical protein
MAIEVGVPNGTAANLALPETGSHAASPVNGVIVHWSVVDTEGPAVTLSVLQPAGGASYKAVGSSAPTAISGLGRQTFAADIPIQTGDVVGLNLVEADRFGLVEMPGATAASWIPALPEGDTAPYSTVATGGEIAVNAEVQVAPTITALNPVSGAIVGGTSVTITGTDLEGATAVRFGSTPASSFAVNSESQITAVAPPSAAVAGVPVTVTTVAGTATSPTPFTYQGCVVPKLNGKKLKAAKKGLKKADCKLGKVTKKKGATSKSGKVGKQSPKAGKILVPGSKVNVKLKA